jgi:hypothetical protein
MAFHILSTYDKVDISLGIYLPIASNRASRKIGTKYI